MSLPYPMQYRGEVEGVSKIRSRSNSFNLTHLVPEKLSFTSLFRHATDKTQCLNNMTLISSVI